MKRIMGILFLVFLISPPLIVPAFESTQDYSFRLAWDGPPRTSSTTFFDDITGDGLQEIMYSERDEDGTLFFTTLDTYGTTLWRVPLEGSLLWYISKDIDDNGLRDHSLISTGWRGTHREAHIWGEYESYQHRGRIQEVKMKLILTLEVSSLQSLMRTILNGEG